MKFFAKSIYGIIMTDDYSIDEINNNKHINNIINDFNSLFGNKKSFMVKVYDEYNNFVFVFPCGIGWAPGALAQGCNHH